MVQKQFVIEKPIRILQVFGIMNRGGAESMLMNLYRSIDRRKIQFDFIVHTNKKGAFDEEIESLGGTIYHCPRYSVKGVFSYRKWWKSFFASHPNYHIVHSHVRSTASIIFKIAHRFGLKTISHSHSISNGSGIKSLVKKIYQISLRKQSDYCVACSNNSAEWLFGKGIANSEHFLLLKNAIDCSVYKFNEQTRNIYRKLLGINDKKVLIHVGNFREPKNHKFLIDVFSLVKNRNSDLALLLVGDGELKNNIQNLVNKKKLQDDVFFLGQRDDVYKLLQASDLFLLPSLWEGLPVSVVEAQASGLPCIISDKITDEVVISPYVSKIPIEKGAEEWILPIEEAIQTQINRLLSISYVIDADYDIVNNANKLEKFYLQIEESFNE